MPINIESTLQSIRQGGTLPQNTLAGQVGAMQQARKKQQAAILQAMQEAQLAQQKEQRQGVKLAHDMQQDQREAALKNRLNTLTTLEQLARQDPAQAGRLLTSSERGRRLAFKLGVDPQNPDPDKIKAYRDGLFAEVSEKRPETSDQWRPLTQEEKRQYPNLDPNKSYQINNEGRVRDLESGQEINIGGQESKYQQETGTFMAELQGQHTEEAIRADEQLRQLDSIETGLLAVEKGGFKTGFLGDFRQLASQAFEYFNVDPGIVNLGTATNSEIIDAMSGDLAIKLAENLDRATNLQFRTVKRAVPNLGKTVQGNLILTNLMKRNAQRSSDLGKIASAFRAYSKNGSKLDKSVTVNGITYPAGTTYQEAINKYDESKQEIDEETQKYIRNAAKYEEAKIAPTYYDEENGVSKIDKSSMEVGGVYMMPDGKVIERTGPDTFKVVGELDAE